MTNITVAFAGWWSGGIWISPKVGGSRERGNRGSWGNSEQNKIQDLSHRTVISYKDATKIILIPYFIPLKGDNILTSFSYMTSAMRIVKELKKKRHVNFSLSHLWYLTNTVTYNRTNRLKYEKDKSKTNHCKPIMTFNLKSVHRSRAGHGLLGISFTALPLCSVCLSVPELQSRHGSA